MVTDGISRKRSSRVPSFIFNPTVGDAEASQTGKDVELNLNSKIGIILKI